MPDMAEHASMKRTLKGWQAGLVATTVLLLTLALLAAAAASSYDNLWHLAVVHHVPFPRLNPVELDGGLVVIGLIDMVFTWSGCPLGMLRLLSRLLGAGTIAANVAAGWPDLLGGFLRSFAPAIIVVITEAVRAFLLRRNPEIQDARIPVIRWVLSPWPTFVLWRRMRLWDIGSYRAAVDMELSRRQAIVQLAMKFGPEWKRKAPADLVWMLRAGVRMSDALARVRELTGLEAAAAPGPVTAGATGPGAGSTAPRRTAATGRRPAAVTGRKPEPVTGPSAPEAVTVTAPDEPPADFDSEAKVLWYLEKGKSASEAGRLAGLTDSRGRQIARLAKTAPRDIVDGSQELE